MEKPIGPRPGTPRSGRNCSPTRRARREFLPNYCQRDTTRQYSGWGQTEKLTDLLVARRQTGQGRHWSPVTSDALVALPTLLLNSGWARYWQQRQVLPLLAS